MNQKLITHQLQEMRDETKSQITHAAQKLLQKITDTSMEPRHEIKKIIPESILPFATNPNGQVLPAHKGIFENIVNGYEEPTEERVAELSQFAGAPENYGTAPGPCAAFLESLIKAFNPRTVFTFGTARGDMESLIAHSCDAEIVTMDISSSEIDEKLIGVPDDNNIRYRDKIGITCDEDIGSKFRSDNSISGRVHQLLQNSFSFTPNELAGTMDLIFIDACHQMPNVLMDLVNALKMINRQDGGIIVLDDFRKGSPLNAGVEASSVLFSQFTGIPVLTTCPKPGENGLKADVGVFVISPEFFKDEEKVNRIISTLSTIALQAKESEIIK